MARVRAVVLTVGVIGFAVVGLTTRWMASCGGGGTLRPVLAAAAKK